MIDAYIAHLQEVTAQFKRITHAKDQEPVDQLDEELPLIGVFPGEDSTSSQEVRTDYFEAKTIETNLLVHLVCAVEDFEGLRNVLRDASIGWCMDGYHTDLTLMEGHVIQLKGGVIWWQDKYSSRHQVRENPARFKLQSGAYLLIGGDPLE